MMNVDIAKRVYDHGYRLDPIIRSLADNDFYKLLMTQLIRAEMPARRVGWTLINRNPAVRLADLIEERELRSAPVQRVTEAERARIEESLRRLASSLHGGLTHKKQRSNRGRINVSRTMRSNMKYDGVPFRPVTTRLDQDFCAQP